MTESAFLLAPALTIALAGAFLITDTSGAGTVYQPMSGKVWSMKESDVPTAVPAAVVNVSTAPPAVTPVVLVKTVPPPVRVVARRSRHSVLAKIVKREKAARVAQIAPAVQGATTAPRAAVSREPQKVALSTASAPAPAKVAASPSSEYALEDIADRFENDESKFPLDRSVDAGGVALHLMGLEKLPTMFVLKIAVANSSDADFFVKGFTVASGRQDLSSNSDFRVLVETRRTREGYVLFERPSAGSDVHLKLKEDGGKGRSLETAIPYPF